MVLVYTVFRTPLSVSIVTTITVLNFVVLKLFVKDMMTYFYMRTTLF